MKKHFTKYLIEDLGFKPFRLINNKYVENNINDFSTLQDGGIDIRYIKEDIVIAWGLHEIKKPPTLIYPRPKILFNGMNERYDDAMNVCLKKESNEDIFKGLFDKNILFNYSD
jgi:hypothetical protein